MFIHVSNDAASPFPTSVYQSDNLKQWVDQTGNARTVCLDSGTSGHQPRTLPGGKSA
ncbi:hypothetical protein NSND_60245 [Nitrospira sp. ND1]|jgi:hypothetical protein|nr:hypothetical protein NSND_60245 [Nitrospira sp. ND1]